MADDLYKTLGVSKSATDQDIRKAYRKLAKEHHPDLNPGDTSAEERFKKISAAYEILGDSKMRARYDKGEIDATGAEQHQQKFYRHYAGANGGERYHSAAGFGDFGTFSDLYSDLFSERSGGGRVQMRGPDRRYHLDIDFLDAVFGAKRRLTMPDGATLDVNIPAGIRDGGSLRLKGRGDEGIGGGPNGDALIEITVRPHPVFTRVGDDIEIELPITIDEAVLGAKVEVPTISGQVSVTIPKGASSGKTLRLRGKGVQSKGRPAGDQLIRLQIVLPDEIDAELAALMERWREQHRYDPRRKLRRLK